MYLSVSSVQVLYLPVPRNLLALQKLLVFSASFCSHRFNILFNGQIALGGRCSFLLISSLQRYERIYTHPHAHTHTHIRIDTYIYILYSILFYYIRLYCFMLYYIILYSFLQDFPVDTRSSTIRWIATARGKGGAAQSQLEAFSHQ